MTVYNVGAGTTSSGLVISSGDELVVGDGGTVISTTILNGGLEQLLEGSLSSSGTVEEGGTVQFTHGNISADLAIGVVTSATVFSGVTISTYGIIDLVAEGVDAGVTLSMGYEAVVGYLTVSSGGVVAGGQGQFVGSNFIDSGGSASGVTVAGSGHFDTDLYVSVGPRRCERLADPGPRRRGDLGRRRLRRHR